MNGRSPNRPRSCDCDIVVLGGGPAGAAAAITLARAGHSVIVIEKSKYERARIGETLPPRARMSLMRLGVWEAFLSGGHLSSPAVASVWGEEELRERQYVFSPYGSGWHLDRRLFDTMLIEAARQAGVNVCSDAHIVSCQPLQNGEWQVEVTFDDGADRKRRLIHAALAIDATGRVAVLARQQGARRINTDHLVGLACMLDAGPRDGDGRADQYGGCTLVEASTDGWWYTARLPGHRLIAVYMTDADLLPRSRPMRRSFWQARWQQTNRTRERIEGCAVETDPCVVAANSSFLDPVAGAGWLAVGDAAAAFDPLSSQGLNHALASAVRGAEVLIDRLKGEPQSFAAYQDEVSDTIRTYSRLSAYFYGREQRWPQSLFWLRRHARLTTRTEPAVTDYASA